MDAALFSKEKEIPIKFGSKPPQTPQTAGYLRVRFYPSSANRFPLRTYDSYDIPHMETTSTSREAARRSTRIRAQIPVRITVIESSSHFSQSCHTLVVNTAGCAVQLSQPLELGTAACIDQLPNQRTAIARVANCVPLGAGSQYWLVGLALDEPENIWEIHPAPADWGTESAVALAAITATNASVPTKKGGWPYRQFSHRGEFHPAKI